MTDISRAPDEDLPWIDLPGDPATGLLLIGDHASARVPGDIDLGIDAVLLREHVAVDIGVAELAAALCAALGCPAILGGVSRLVADLNREEDRPGLVPVLTDGHAIPGNAALDVGQRAARIERFWRPYHAHLRATIAATRPQLLVSLHSFTPMLKSVPEPRPWEVGILYNEDDRAARVALPLLEGASIVAGDNLPYSGKLLNATMNAHGEANGIPYLGIEVRQDLIDHPLGVERWAAALVPVIRACLAAF